MNNQKIIIKLKAFDHELLDKATKEIVGTVVRTGAEICGPIPLPRRIKRFTVNRSPHIDKDSREHFEIRLYKRFVDITLNSASVLDSLLKTELPAGVSCSLKILAN